MVRKWEDNLEDNPARFYCLVRYRFHLHCLALYCYHHHYLYIGVLIPFRPVCSIPPGITIIGALGVIKKGLEKYVDRIPGTVSIDELQKITLLGSARILRKVLSMK